MPYAGQDLLYCEIETISESSTENTTPFIDILVLLYVLKSVFSFYLYSVPTSTKTQIMVKSFPPSKKLGARLETGLVA